MFTHSIWSSVSILLRSVRAFSITGPQSLVAVNAFFVSPISPIDALALRMCFSLCHRALFLSYNHRSLIAMFIAFKEQPDRIRPNDYFLPFSGFIWWQLASGLVSNISRRRNVVGIEAIPVASQSGRCAPCVAEDDRHPCRVEFKAVAEHIL